MGSINVGYGGTGLLTVSNDGNISSTNTYVGTNDGSDGTLSIENGGVLNDTNGWIGYQDGSTGRATVEGTWTNSSGLVVGDNGTGNGTLTIQNGGNVTNTYGYLGAAGSSTGTATVTGNGSTWQSTAMIVGETGNGTLTVSDGGFVHSGSYVTVGRNTDAVGRMLIETGGVVTDDGDGEIAYAGGQGEVTVTGDGSQWNIATGLVMTTTLNTGVATLTVADGGEVSADHISLGIGTSTVNIGAGALDAAAAPGTLAISQVNFGSGTGTLVFNHTSDDYTFAPILNGAGAVEVLTGTTALTADNSVFAGVTHIGDGAILEVDNKLSGTINVDSGGLLQGIGTIKAFTLPTGATLAPGNQAAGGAPGTLTVSGAYTQDADATLQIAATPAAVGALVVNGVATLDGSLVLVPVAGAWQRGATYEILSASGGVNGAFDTVTDAHPGFATFDVSYQSGAVFITVGTASNFFGSIAQTTSQKNLAGTLDTLAPHISSGAFNNTLNTLYAAPSAQNIDTLNGYVMTGLVTGAAANMQAVMGNVATRLGTASGGFTLADEFGPDDTVLVADADPNDWGPDRTIRGDYAVWAQGLNTISSLRDTADAPGQHSQTSGTAFGMEKRLTHHDIIGATFGIASTGVTINATSQSGRQVSYITGVYGKRDLKGGYTADASVVGGFNHATSRRDVALLGTRANGQTDGYGATLDGGVSRCFALGEDATLTPRFGLDYIYNYENGYTETGAPGANLTFDSTRQTLIRSTLAATVEKSSHLSRNSGVLDELRSALTLGMRHDWRPVRAVVNESFAGVSASNFTTRSVTPGRETLLTGLGLSFVPGDLKTLEVYGRYDGAYADHESDNTLTLGAKFNW